MSYAVETPQTSGKPSDAQQMSDFQKFADRVESAVARVKSAANRIGNVASNLYGEMAPTPEDPRRLEPVGRGGAVGNVEDMIRHLHTELDGLEQKLMRLNTLV